MDQTEIGLPALRQWSQPVHREPPTEMTEQQPRRSRRIAEKNEKPLRNNDDDSKVTRCNSVGDLLGPADGLAFGTAVGGPSAGAVICGVAGNDDDSDATIPFPEDDKSLRQLGLVSFSGGVRTLDDTRYNNAGVTVGQLLGLERVGREARCWTSEDVAEWLPSIGAAFRQYKTVFVDNGVDGKFLLGIIGGDNEEQANVVMEETLKVKSAIHRMALISAARKLRGEAE